MFVPIHLPFFEVEDLVQALSESLEEAPQVGRRSKNIGNLPKGLVFAMKIWRVWFPRKTKNTLW